MTEAPASAGVPQWTLADRIRKARDYAGLTRVELALKSGVSLSSIGNYETGKTTPLPLHLRELARATEVDLAWLQNGETGPPTNGGTALFPQFSGGKQTRSRGPQLLTLVAAA
jgi:transcriptional regulator with XRE-family HTH domain